MESTLPNPQSNDIYMITENPTPSETETNQNPNAPNNSSQPVRANLKDIKKRLIISLKLHGFVVKLEAVKSKAPIDDVLAKYKSYNHCITEMAKKRGNANVKRVLYAASSKDECDAFASYCFGSLLNHPGQAFSFSAIYQSLPSEILSVPADEDGIRRVLLCSILLGNVEVVSPYSGQFGPSSEEFDSGADDLVSPSKYFVWNVNATTRVLPLYVLCFRPSDKVIGRCKSSSSGRTEPGFGSLIIKDMLKFIPADAKETIDKHHLEFKNNKIKRPEMIRRLRGIVGDELWNRFITPELEKVLKLGKKHKPVKQKEDRKVVEGLIGQFSGGFNI